MTDDGRWRFGNFGGCLLASLDRAEASGSRKIGPIRHRPCPHGACLRLPGCLPAAQVSRKLLDSPSSHFFLTFFVEPLLVRPGLRQTESVENSRLVTSLRIETQAELVESTLGQEHLLARLSGFFGVLGLLAAAGLFGLISSMFRLRTREVGLRLVLGAQTRDLVSSIMWQSAPPVRWPR